MACRLSTVFRHLCINGRSLSTASHARTSPNAVPSFRKLQNSTSPSIYEPNFTLSPKSVDFGFTIPPPDISRISITETPISINRHIEEPYKIIHNKEDIVPDKFVDLPTLENIIEKHAVRMIIVRRHKMKVHKLKKLRKKMKYVNMKVKKRRKLRREKGFKKHIFNIVHNAEKFNPKRYVRERLQLLTREILPTRWRGEILPPAVIREFVYAQRRKVAAKKNKKRLTL
ncbi:uncharacterized protein LOC117178189 [Belonocnema kinseyi]|uniref:uncharacterized protein LOC117178189 n=1 Tax=Belonocnema kinseyi TaxID=2817044 RepID=UPI00143E0D3B|nr:uncharacterized protein LOC117178189 [Belonocnema kinseyi]